jgi:hypothetical protein
MPSSMPVRYCYLCARRNLTFAIVVGTMIGVVALVYLIEQSGEGTKYIENQFPSLFESPKWKSVESALESQQQYGLVGVGLVSAMPIILHPIIVFCMLGETHVVTDMPAINDLRLILVTFVACSQNRHYAMDGCNVRGPCAEGTTVAVKRLTTHLICIRTYLHLSLHVQYTVMGALAISAPAALRFFGVDVKKIMGSDNKSKKSS